MDTKVKNFRDLRIWQKGIDIAKDVYNLAASLPKEETFGLSSQMKRAAISISSNIAEGFNRFHNKEYKQFLYIALGSCGELETQIEIAHSMKFISSSNKDNIINEITYLSKMISTLINRLKQPN